MLSPCRKSSLKVFVGTHFIDKSNSNRKEKMTYNRGDSIRALGEKARDLSDLLTRLYAPVGFISPEEINGLARKLFELSFNAGLAADRLALGDDSVS